MVFSQSHAIETKTSIPQAKAIRAAKVLDSGLKEASAAAVEIAGDWLVVTKDTGEGQDYAYEPDDIDVEHVEAEVKAGTWDYSLWCSGISPVITQRHAVGHYLATGRHLGDGGSYILTNDEVALLDLVRGLL